MSAFVLYKVSSFATICVVGNKNEKEHLMTFKEYKDMIEDRNALEAADRAAFSRDQAAISGGGDPDMCITYVAAVVPVVYAVPGSNSLFCEFP